MEYKGKELIYIEWCDAVSNSGGWMDEEESLEWAENVMWIVRECGFLIKETKEYILIANKLTPDSEDALYGNLKKIPKTWIKKRISLDKHVNNKSQ